MKSRIPAYIALAVAVVIVVRMVALSTPDPNQQVRKLWTNIWQVSVATRMYVADNDDRLPIAARWVDATIQYVEGHSELYMRLDQPDQYAFAFNTPIETKPMALFEKRDDVIMLFLSDKGTRNAHDNLKSVMWVNGRTVISRPYQGAQGVLSIDRYLNATYPK